MVLGTSFWRAKAADAISLLVSNPASEANQKCGGKAKSPPIGQGAKRNLILRATLAMPRGRLLLLIHTGYPRAKVTATDSAN